MASKICTRVNRRNLNRTQKNEKFKRLKREDRPGQNWTKLLKYKVWEECFWQDNFWKDLEENLKDFNKKIKPLMNLKNLNNSVLKIILMIETKLL